MRRLYVYGFYRTLRTLVLNIDKRLARSFLSVIIDRQKESTSITIHRYILLVKNILQSWIVSIAKVYYRLRICVYSE